MSWEASPQRHSRQQVPGVIGKPEAFRTGSGKAARDFDDSEVDAELVSPWPKQGENDW